MFQLIQEFFRVSYQHMKNVDHYGCLTKRNCQLNSSFVGVGDASFHSKSGVFLKTNLSFRILQLTEGFGV